MQGRSVCVWGNLRQLHPGVCPMPCNVYGYVAVAGMFSVFSGTAGQASMVSIALQDWSPMQWQKLMDTVDVHLSTVRGHHLDSHDMSLMRDILKTELPSLGGGHRPYCNTTCMAAVLFVIIAYISAQHQCKWRFIRMETWVDDIPGAEWVGCSGQCGSCHAAMGLPHLFQPWFCNILTPARQGCSGMPSGMPPLHLSLGPSG